MYIVTYLRDILCQQSFIWFGQTEKKTLTLMKISRKQQNKRRKLVKKKKKK